jgi:hypothetical protein
VTKSVNEFIQAVENAYESFDCKLQTKIFLTLQSSMLEITLQQKCHIPTDAYSDGQSNRRYRYDIATEV